MSRLITFTSDYGPDDEFVGVCHAVIARIAPESRVIDIAHGVRGVRAVSAVLRQSLRYAPRAINLAVVDPGVGTDRRGVVIATADGSILVGPDNGLLLPAADVLGGPSLAFELLEPRFRLEPTSATFHGRDIFAPAAAHIARGITPHAFGPPLDVDDLVRLPPAKVEVADGVLVSECLRTEGFGNLQLAATDDDFERAALGRRVRVVCDAGTFEAVVGRTFADASPGSLVVLTDAAGQTSVAVNGGSAAERLGRPSDVRLERM